ncbi:MAG: hypothetical protein J7L91_04595 [Candidatus Korarchaeota archaeon]|nr:hypothetical protein [Candidatus Korarchaeota archaeon]
MAPESMAARRSIRGGPGSTVLLLKSVSVHPRLNMVSQAPRQTGEAREVMMTKEQISSL